MLVLSFPARLCRRMKAEVFGPSTFWVTETRALAVQSLDLGVVVRGNLRGPLDVVYADVCRRMEQLFGELGWAGAAGVAVWKPGLPLSALDTPSPPTAHTAPPLVPRLRRRQVRRAAGGGLGGNAR